MLINYNPGEERMTYANFEKVIIIKCNKISMYLNNISMKLILLNKYYVK